MKTKIVSILLGTVALALAGVVNAEPRQTFKPGDKTIAEIATQNGGFTTLVAALTCTDLVGAVDDPYAELTVFAPTDAAFAKNGLNSGNICDTFDEAVLADILLYHVVGERRPSPSVIRGKNKEIMMLAGGSIYPEGLSSVTLLDNLGREVNIVLPDQLASNGIVHVVDDVLLPFAP